MDSDLWPAVRLIAETMQALPDASLSREWTWRDHSEGLRFALLGTYHELRHLAASLAGGRVAAGNPTTTAQLVLTQFHAAHRDLQAVLLGVGDEELDIPPAEGEWPLRQVMEHMIGADRMFFALVHYAVKRHRAGEEPGRITSEDVEALLGPVEAFRETVKEEGLAGIVEYHEALHGRIVRELADLSEEELDARAPFWEDDPHPVRYRLHRFDAHLRQHTVQVEKTLAAIGRQPNEARRLLRLVYSALAEAEGALFGAWELGTGQRQEAARVIASRVNEVANLR